MKISRVRRRTLRFPIFAAEDLAVVGGRKFVAELNRYDLSGVTDVFLDVSAMSVGIYFPVFCLLLQRTEKLHFNFHLLLTSSPNYDRLAVPTYTDRIASLHGMSFEADVLGERRSPNEGRLRLPQLRIGTNQECARIFDAIGPDDVCPILPFPSRDPRTDDLTAMSFASEFDLWDVDPRSVLLASDSNPLDVYRSIIRCPKPACLCLAKRSPTSFSRQWVPKQRRWECCWPHLNCRCRW